MEHKYFCEKIAEVCFTCFKTLPKSGKPTNQEWTVLSCIVQEINSHLIVVALGTGSKCIGKSKMSEKGDILNDSHAEIICRRSFLRYLYNEMNDASNIFNYNADIKKFCLKPEVKFHFFTTHVPCGDAAIFPKQNSSDFGDIIENNEGSPIKRTKIDDIYRTGAKCLEGSSFIDNKLPGVDFHVTGVVRTKPGRGDPTLSVSCSDKLAKWSHLGIQGALLSLLLDKPIYLTSFIISDTPFSESSMKRALYQRLDVSLKPPYGRYEMDIGQSSKSYEFGKKDKKQPCPSSISYYYGSDKKVEVIVEGKRQGVTKKKLATEAGRVKICKVELFKLFLKVCKDKNIILKTNCDNYNLSYRSVKLLSKDYQDAWDHLRQCFKTWTVKNPILLEFSVK